MPSHKPHPVVNDIGVDVSKADFYAAIDNPDLDLKKLAVKKFPRSPEGVTRLLAWLRQVLGGETPIRLIMEATGLYSEQLADMLLAADASCLVVIANPRAVADFAKSHSDTKTDNLDARVLARFGAGRRLIEYVPLPDDQKPLRAMVRCRKELVSRISAEKQRRQEYQGLAVEVTAIQDRLIAQLEQEKQALDRHIKAFIKANPKLKKSVATLKQICGVGDTIAAAVVAELGDLTRFKSHKQLVAFVGLKPREYSSGTSVKKRTRMSKRGSSYIRALLYMAAMAAVGSNNRFARQYEELVGRGMVRKAALGAIMRKILVVMRALVKNDAAYEDTHQSCGKTKPACGETVESCGNQAAA